jgi:hypothetical protein
MLRTTLQAIEHDEDALVSLPASHTLAQIVRKADKSFKRQLSRCPDIPAFFVSPLRVHLEPWFGDAVADSAFVGLLWGCQPGFLSVGHDLNAKYHHAMTLMTGTMANKHQSGLCPVRRRMLIAGIKTTRNETSMKAGE